MDWPRTCSTLAAGVENFLRSDDAIGQSFFQVIRGGAVRGRNEEAGTQNEAACQLAALQD